MSHLRYPFYKYEYSYCINMKQIILDKKKHIKKKGKRDSQTEGRCLCFSEYVFIVYYVISHQRLLYTLSN